MNPEIQNRVELFRTVRDIPYYISLGERQDYSCSTKAEILDRLLQSLELKKSRHRICEFRWEELDLPDKVLKIPHEDPEYHQFLEVYIPEKSKYVVADPTWDSGLKEKFEIAEWDGLTDTKIAVSPKKIYSPEKSSELIKELNRPDELKRYLKKNREFLNSLNEYLDNLRKSPSRT